MATTFAALDRLDARRVADRTIVHQWNDGASTSDGKRAFVPTWGKNANGTANVVDDSRHVSSHDLRRRFAQRLLVDERMNPRVVMAVGGWNSFQAIEPYLNAPSESAFLSARVRRGGFQPLRLCSCSRKR